MGSAMSSRIVSLRENIEFLDQRDSRLRQMLGVFAGVITSIERHLFRLYGEKLQAPVPTLEPERQTLLHGADDEDLARVGRRIDQQLSATAGLIRTRLAGVVELEEVVMLLDSATQSINCQTSRQSNELGQVQGNLRRVMHLETVAEFRAQIQAQVNQLEKVMEDMKRENQALLDDLQREMHSYRRQLDRANTGANMDALTGLGNRRTFESRVEELIQAQVGFCLLLIDFNRFKSINDQHGHLAGDELLRAFAERLQNHIREDDTAVRWGGDEFVVLLPLNLSSAMARARMLESSLSGDYRIQADGKQLRVRLGFSIGVSEYRLGETVQQVVARADKLLYQAKCR